MVPAIRSTFSNNTVAMVVNNRSTKAGYVACARTHTHEHKVLIWFSVIIYA